MLFRVIYFIVVTADVNESKVRIPRNVMELGGMVGKVTGKNIFDVYSSYNGYGCFCGIGGGGRPVDGVDRCVTFYVDWAQLNIVSLLFC